MGGFAAFMIVLLFVVGVVVAGTTVLFRALRTASIKAERRRLDAFYAWTMASGWRMHEGDAATRWRPRLAHLRGFRMRRFAYGTVGVLPVTAADCRYETTSTNSQGTQTIEVNLAVFVATLPGMWPEITVGNRSLGSRVLQSLGGHSGTEIGHPEFDRRFRVDAADPYAARTLLSPALIDAHLRDQAPNWSISGGELMVVERHRLTPEHIPPGVDRLRRLAAVLGVPS
ncbi:hypothetical protein [Actinoallomurus iriomotensis]|uniref:Uncharacterized protein n=1 Tax=Actinoallomurus iriomotensis TaxID=478107 RepID=A0A9W6RVB5_9ACTN|nr:hypothetical protein [Actinoallomurus iriomotensis]GLY82545.1 hypothetical protein Airi02_004770 [Actinoallomurus iriomotensis]